MNVPAGLRLRLALRLAQEQEDSIEQEIEAHDRVARRRRRRRVWVRPWLLRRPVLGAYEQLMQELRLEDEAAFTNFLRMEPAMFQELVDRVGPRIRRQETWYRKPLEPGLRIAITLRHLASGASYHDLMYSFRVAHNTISLIVAEVCQAIRDEYAVEVMSCPVTPEEWRPVTELFSSRWNFHHAVGAIDGKHIAIQCPKNGGSAYFNYKGFHSLVLLALVDADYKFLWINVGAEGGASDAQLFNHCELKEALESGDLGLPAPEPLPHDDEDMPFFVIGDDAFALRTWMMKPFSRRNMSVEERIFNYRLSRARRIVENAFGILANRFRVILTTMKQTPETVTKIVMACCTLHNLMRIRYPAAQNAVADVEDTNHDMVPGEWRNNFHLADLQRAAGGNRITKEAKAQREYLMAYYNSPAGAVPWQGNMI